MDFIVHLGFTLPFKGRSNDCFDVLLSGSELIIIERSILEEL